MVGDVNIYMNDLDDPQMAEVEIMIAEPKRYTCFISPISALTLSVLSLVDWFLHLKRTVCCDIRFLSIVVILK